MRNIYLICVGLFIVSVSKAQKNEYEAPKVIHYPYSKSDKKYGIRYHLPTSAAELLDSVFRNDPDRYKNADYLIELRVNGDTVKMFGYLIKHRFKHLKKDEPVRLIAYATHRYILIDNKRVPFYFDTDATFGFVNFVFSGYDLYIKFIGTKLDEGAIIEQDIH